MLEKVHSQASVGSIEWLACCTVGMSVAVGRSVLNFMELDTALAPVPWDQTNMPQSSKQRRELEFSPRPAEVCLVAAACEGFHL